jgi:putative membrane protein
MFDFTTTPPLYMDGITLYFIMLPFLMAAAIAMAKKGKIELHYKMQLAIFIVTLIVIVIFEIGVRLSGGFSAFMQTSNANLSYMTLFLIVHILIALVSVVLYFLVVYSAYRVIKLKKKPLIKKHKFFGSLVFLGMSITSFMGTTIYYYLFIY